MPHDVVSPPPASGSGALALPPRVGGARRNIAHLPDYLGRLVTVYGRVAAVRRAKGVSFVELRDRTGSVQVVCREPISTSTVTAGSAVRTSGTVVTGRRTPGAVELAADALDVLSIAALLPEAIEPGGDARALLEHLDTRSLDRVLMFEVQTAFEAAAREFLIGDGFIEIHTPKITPGGSESGAAVFTVPYFGHTACLAQSPQFYMQLSMASGFDRTFEVGPVFRAEPAITNRHATEFTCLDVEMSWVESHEDLMTMEERMLHHALSTVQSAYGPLVRERFGVDVEVPVLPIPRLSYAEAVELAGEKGRDSGRLTHTAEQLLTTWSHGRHGHGFVFVTDFPASERPFYTMRSAANAVTSRSFDLLWRGIEVTSGCQREHRPERLRDQMAPVIGSGELNAGYLTDCYLEMFRYGCPPHGGFGIGLNRLVMALLARPSIRDASFVFRGAFKCIP